MKNSKKGLVPYDMAPPGFEAVYTGEKMSPRAEERAEQAGMSVRDWMDFALKQRTP